MNSSKAILIGVQPEDYEKLSSLLESDYLISSNLGSQEMILDSIPKFKATALIINEGITGTRSIHDFYMVLKQTHPNLRIVFFTADGLEFVIPYISGDREIPPYFQETIEDIDTVDAYDEELEVAKPAKEGITGLRKWLNRNRTGKDDDRSEEQEQEKEEIDDWERTAEATYDIHNKLKKVVLVTGASGGIGKTDVAINLSVHASSNGFSTVLCGFNLQNDDTAGRLGLDYKRGKKLMSAYELYANDKLTYAAIVDMLQDYGDLKVLVGIEKPEERQDMNEEFFKHIVRILRANHDLIVIDTENNSFSPAYFSMIEVADHILVPCTTHNSVLEQLKEELYSWKNDFGFPLSKVDIVFNKAGEGGFVQEHHIEKYTTREVIATIPYSKDVLRGSEREQPAVLRNSADGRKIRKELNKILFRVTGLINKDALFVKSKFTLFRKKVMGVAKS